MVLDEKGTSFFFVNNHQMLTTKKVSKMPCYNFLPTFFIKNLEIVTLINHLHENLNILKDQLLSMSN